MSEPALKRPDLSQDDVQTAVERILAAGKLVYVWVDQTQIIRKIQGNAALILGLNNPSIFVGQDLMDLLGGFKIEHPTTHADVTHDMIRETIAASAQTDETDRQTVILTTADGRRLKADCLFETHGSCSILFKDISTEAGYRDLFEISLDAANAGFWNMDFQTGKLTLSDSVTRRLSPKEIEQTESKGLFSIIHPKDLQYVTSEWANIIQTRRPFDLKYRICTESNPLMWQRSIGQINCAADGTPVGATAFVMDITADVDKTEALEIEKSASRAKSEFMARMSHEIKTPLNAIIGMTDCLRTEHLSEDVVDIIEDVHGAAVSLNELLNRTLDYTKLTYNSIEILPQETNIHRVLKSTARLWKQQITAKGLGFKLLIDPNLPEKLLLDEIRVQQCLNNLLSNATKFTSEGSITLVAQRALVKKQDKLIILVKDTGIGIKKDDINYIFDAYRQADGSIQRNYGGTGLGMTIAQDLCERMGGKIKVRSEFGKGSTFAVILPLSAAGSDTRDNKQGSPVLLKAEPIIVNVADESSCDIQEESDDPCFSFNKLNFLCVEDNMVNQKVVDRMLSPRVSQLYFASNGREALDILNSVKIDVVLMDIHMPVMDGIEATLEIRKSEENYSDVVIIAVTADSDYQQRKICRNIGMDDAIGKPLKRQTFYEAISRNIMKSNISADVRNAQYG